MEYCRYTRRTRVVLKVSRSHRQKLPRQTGRKFQHSRKLRHMADTFSTLLWFCSHPQHGGRLGAIPTETLTIECYYFHRCRQLTISSFAVGMPQSVHNAASILSSQSSEIDEHRGQQRAPDKSHTIRPSYDSTVAVRPVGRAQSKDKQSFDYVLKTGLAGGLAGCAV